jgi:Tol biopolymer transport system component
VYSLGAQTTTRLTRQFNAVDGSWSKDGKQLVFTGSESVATPGDLYLVDADGASEPTRLLERPDGQFQPMFASGGREVVFMDRTSGGDRLMRFGPGQGASPEFLSRSGTNEASPALSPDGRWLAFHSNESGQTEIYVRPYPGPGSRVIVSSGGGAEPVWSGSGQTLFYRSGTTLVAAQLRIGTEVSVTGRSLLFSVPYLRGRGNRNYDVAPDGSRFVFVKNTNPPRLVVQLNVLAPEPR